MTRAAQRILDRARASAWRRVGMPIMWNQPAPVRHEFEETNGKNVATENGKDPGTGRHEDAAKPVTSDPSDS